MKKRLITKPRPILPALLLLAASAASAQATTATSASTEPYHRVFIFGQNARGSNTVTALTTAAPYSPGWGFGFEGASASVETSSIGGNPFFFSFDAPEGNYKIN